MVTRVADVRTAQAPGTIGLDDDKALVLAFQSGEVEVYSDIYVKYRALAAQICYRILQDREEADEAVQETMLRVFRGLPRFNGRYQLQAWVARIATNVSLDMVRARSRRPQRGPALQDISDEHVALAAFPGEDTSDVVERVLDQEEVRSTLEAIPDHHREALMLREFEGRSHEEIGDALGVSPQQAKALIHRAKKSFRRAWGEGEERRGIAALAPILLAPFRLPGLLRRLIQPAHDAVTSATATVQQAAVQATAAPTAVQTAMSAADKVTAAAITVIVAGTMSVGVVAIRHHSTPPSKPAPAVASPAPAPSVPAAVTPPVRERPAVKPHHKPPPRGSPRGTGWPDLAELDPEPHDVAVLGPEHQPSPDGSETPPPPPPPAPAWSASFETSVGLQATNMTSVGVPMVSGYQSGTITFAETMTGNLIGPKGKLIGDVYVDFGGAATETAGRLTSLLLFLDTPEGRYTYGTDASLSSVVHRSDGSTAYEFSGQYALSGLPSSLETVVPHDGQLQIQLSFWQDGTLYATDVTMSDA